MLTVTLSVRSLLFALGLVGLGLLATVEARATNYNVDTTADIIPFPPDPRISLRSALNSANSNPGPDKIILPAGIYTLNITGSGDDTNSAGDLDIRDSVTITGAGPDKTIIDGKDLNDRIFHLPYDGYSPRINVLISNLTIQNGKLTATDANMGGGGIYNRQTLTLNNVVVKNNSVAGAGGGGIQSDHELTLNKVVVQGNRVDEVGDVTYRTGGGIYNSALYSGSMVMTDSIVAGNRARVGAGIYTYDALIERSLLTGNWAGIYGGAILSVGALQLVNATIHANTSDYGAALRVSAGEAQISFCTITGNQSFGSHPAVFVDPSASLALHNSILANNYTGTNEILNCSLSYPPTSATYNLEDANTCEFSKATNMINTDPKLGPLQDNGGPTQTRALAADSPAIDYVRIDTGVTVDQRGFTPPVGPWADIGAYEYEPPPLCFPVKSPDGKTAVICL
ncbi:MAG: choice-of-anchor Q domain-containing protein [Desulfobulbus sp.]|nr:choice-of-anchor Q domain-containing protein [Desulfobulbus sp.]